MYGSINDTTSLCVREVTHWSAKDVIFITSATAKYICEGARFAKRVLMRILVVLHQA